MKRSILLCQERIHGGGVVGPGVEASVEDVGEVAFERWAGFAGCFSFGEFAG